MLRNRRIAGVRVLRSGSELSINDLDEALFPLPQLIDYRATLAAGKNEDILKLTLQVAPTCAADLLRSVQAELARIPAVREAVASSSLKLEAACTEASWTASTGVGKKLLIDERMKNRAHGSCSDQSV